MLYVGKARSLKKRVASYTKFGGHTNRIARMISSTASMEFITTETETEALLLESNLIKQLKPRFNVLLRDDKSFPHILIEAGDFPLMRKHRGARKTKGKYFGPFASAGAVNRTLNQMQKAFLLRTCSDSVFSNRTRPACCTRSNVARPPVPMKSAPKTMQRWSTMPCVSWKAAPPRCRLIWRTRWPRPPPPWSSNAPPSTATASAP